MACLAKVVLLCGPRAKMSLLTRSWRTGEEAVVWIMKNAGCNNKKEAVAVGQQIMNRFAWLFAPLGCFWLRRFAALTNKSRWWPTPKSSRNPTIFAIIRWVNIKSCKITEFSSFWSDLEAFFVTLWVNTLSRTNSCSTTCFPTCHLRVYTNVWAHPRALPRSSTKLWIV